MPDTAAPPVELLRGLAVMAEAPGSTHALIAEALGLPDVPTQSDYADVFLFQLYPYASVHVGPEGMMGGEARDRVAGFWRAIGLSPPAEPDHLAALIGLYATLLERSATGTDSDAEALLSRRSRRALLEEHIAPWVFPYLWRCTEIAGPAYAAWASTLAHVLRCEWVADAADATAPDPAHLHRPGLHFRDAPGLPDPREGGAGDFIGGLLAPVRSGITLTRSDLATVARANGLGLRAGERRYALEHLLAQDASSVLTSLAREATRQEEAHRAREPWLGASAAFLAERCRRSSALLEELAA